MTRVIYSALVGELPHHEPPAGQRAAIAAEAPRRAARDHRPQAGAGTRRYAQPGRQYGAGNPRAAGASGQRRAGSPPTRRQETGREAKAERRAGTEADRPARRRHAMSKATDLLSRAGLPARDAYDLPTSAKRFADGGQYRDRDSVERGPAGDGRGDAERGRARRAHPPRQPGQRHHAADRRRNPRDGRARARQHGIEVCLFVGPRANWDIGVQAASVRRARARVIAARRRSARVRHRGRAPRRSPRPAIDPRRRSRPPDASSGR